MQKGFAVKPILLFGSFISLILCHLLKLYVPLKFIIVIVYGCDQYRFNSWRWWYDVGGDFEDVWLRIKWGKYKSDRVDIYNRFVVLLGPAVSLPLIHVRISFCFTYYKRAYCRFCSSLHHIKSHLARWSDVRTSAKLERIQERENRKLIKEAGLTRRQINTFFKQDMDYLWSRLGTFKQKYL